VSLKPCGPSATAGSANSARMPRPISSRARKLGSGWLSTSPASSNAAPGNSVDAIKEATARLAREGIHISARAASEGLQVEVGSTEWSWPHTWLVIFLEFLRFGYGVRISQP
jgi:hypothetical protein